MSPISRRAAMAAISTAPMVLVVPQALRELAADSRDPLLDALDAYQAGLAAYSAHPIVKRLNITDEEIDSAIAETYGPALETLETWDRPATNLAAATAALEFALEEAHLFAGSDSVEAMIQAALGYLEGRP